MKQHSCCTITTSMTTRQHVGLSMGDSDSMEADSGGADGGGDGGGGGGGG